MFGKIFFSLILEGSWQQACDPNRSALPSSLLSLDAGILSGLESELFDFVVASWVDLEAAGAAGRATFASAAAFNKRHARLTQVGPFPHTWNVSRESYR